jgi:hypothetical protein
MVEASYRVIDVMQDILANLASRCPAGHFDVPDPRDYLSELIATRFRWHRYHLEPDGHGKNGTIVLPLVAASVLADVERMVAELVASLTRDWSATTDYDFRAWKAEWERPDRDLPWIDVSVSDGRALSSLPATRPVRSLYYCEAESEAQTIQSIMATRSSMCRGRSLLATSSRSTRLRKLKQIEVSSCLAKPCR